MAEAAKPGRERVTLVSCMRNEGLFVVEWLAYHRLLGFSDILIFTNNCTDGSDRLLDRLQALGLVTHVAHSPEPGTSPQLNAMRIALEHPKVLAAEWILHIDADEFLFVSAGDGQIGAVIEAAGPADAIAIAWKVFGNSGITLWQGGNVLESFVHSQGVPARRTIHHKSVSRHRKFRFLTDHMPKFPHEPPVVVKNTEGTVISDASLFRQTVSRYKVPFRHITFANACIHHYAIKSDDNYVMKNDRGDGHGTSHTRYYLNSKLHRRYNRNEHEDRRILSRWPEVEAEIARLLADPEACRLNDACLAAYVARRDAVLTPAQVAAWTAAPDVAAGLNDDGDSDDGDGDGDDGDGDGGEALA